MKTILTLSTISMILLIGCSPMITESRQDISFHSEPEGAKIFIDGKLRGKTPSTLSLQRGKYKNIILKKNGYKNTSISMKSRIKDFTMWDGGLSTTTGMIMGSAYEYSSNKYFVELKKSEVSTKF